MFEKQVEKFLKDEIKKLGGICYKFVSPGNSGVPDRIVILPGRVYFVELKTEKGRLSPIQKRQIKKLSDLGQKVFVLYGMEDVRKFINILKGLTMPKKKYNFTWCNKEVLRYESSVKNNKHIFCCNECRSKFLSKKHNPDGYIKHPHLSEYNLKNNPTHPVINDFSVKMKLRDARLGSGEGKSYKKIFGRHEHRIVAERILGRALKKAK